MVYGNKNKRTFKDRSFWFAHRKSDTNIFIGEKYIYKKSHQKEFIEQNAFLRSNFALIKIYLNKKFTYYAHDTKDHYRIGKEISL